MMGRLAGTLRELTLMEFCNVTFLANLPVMPRLEKCVLRNDDEDYMHALQDSYTVWSEEMPALTYLEGVTGFDEEILLLPLQHLRLITDDSTFLPVVGKAMPSLLSITIEGKHQDAFVDNIQEMPAWFGGVTFPNLQELNLWNLDEIAYFPPSLASFTALTELSLFWVGYNNRGEYDFEEEMSRAILDPSIMQITTLRTLNIIECDFNTLPPFFMPSLEFMRIAGCEYLYELPELSVRALPRLAVLELHNLPTIRTLPESLGQLSALTQLHISNCFLESMPMSMHQLSALRDLIMYTSREVNDSSALFHDVAIGLKGLYGLRKLYLSGPEEFSEADLIFIGQSLKAWPPPLLDLMDNKFPILGFRVHPQFHYSGNYHTYCLNMGNESRSTSKYEYPRYTCIVPQRNAAPFNFKRCWRELGLPTEAADWDDGQIMHHWQAMQLKIEAFACVQHPHLCKVPLKLPILHADNVAMIGEYAGDWQRQHHRQVSKGHMSQREQASARENARILAHMRHNEGLLLRECLALSPEITKARHENWTQARERDFELARLLEIETGSAPQCQHREQWRRRNIFQQQREERNNAFMYRVRQEERVRMQARMQALEPQ